MSKSQDALRTRMKKLPHVKSNCFWKMNEYVLQHIFFVKRSMYSLIKTGAKAEKGHNSPLPPSFHLTSLLT